MAVRENIKWRIKRLRAMTPAEVVHRIGEECALKVMRVRHQLGGRSIHPGCHDPARFSFCAGTAPQLPELSWSFDLEGDQAEDLLSGIGAALGREWAWRPEGAPWHTAPDTKMKWPKIFFGVIPYRPGNPYGDVRFAWEPSRLQHLVALGLLAKHPDSRVGGRAVALLEKQFLSWVDANPHMTGIHYISAMECGLRILAVCHALDLIRGKMRRPETVWRALLGLVEGHAWLIAKRLSRYSSAGNHTIAEAAGLVYAGTLFPELPGAKKWKETGCALLEAEAPRQVLEDGGGAEQAFWYQLFILDLYGLATALLAHRNEAVPKAAREAYRRGKRFLSRFADAPEQLPSIGDGDNGHALSPFLRLTFDHPEMERAGNSPGVVSFDQAGYTLIRSGREIPATLVFDHGPLGMAPLYGHGHADALSVLLRLGAEEILIDSGTYQYGGDARWRAYFRGTPAHNTVAVDGKDQAVQEAPFIWSQPFRCKLVRREETPEGRVRLLAFHNGYDRLGKITHWRAVIYDPSGFCFIWDYLTGSGERRLDLHWHLGVAPIEKEGKFLLQGATERVWLSVEGGETSLRRGEAGEISGWKSRLYGVKEPITTIRTRFRGELPHEFVTRVWIGDAPEKAFSPSDELHEISLLMKRIEKETVDPAAHFPLSPLPSDKEAEVGESIPSAAGTIHLSRKGLF